MFTSILNEVIAARIADDRTRQSAVQRRTVRQARRRLGASIGVRDFLPPSAGAFLLVSAIGFFVFIVTAIT